MGYYKNMALEENVLNLPKENEREHKEGYIKEKPVDWKTPNFIKNFFEFITGEKYDY
jgi:hypothetical protein